MDFVDLQTGVLLFRRVYERALQPVCTRYALSRMELDVLLFLADNPQQDTAGDLIRIRKHTKSQVSEAVCHLTEAGLLHADHRAGNRKTVHLSPTSAASAVIEDGRRVRAGLTEAVLGSIDPDELAISRRVMNEVYANLLVLMDGTEG